MCRMTTPELRAPASEIGRPEKVRGLQGLSDQNTYRGWQRTDPEGGPAQRYLVNKQGVPVYLVDPGINGTHKVRPDGSTVTKFDAPKATLMSYIIKGILSRKLPWALVLLGAMIAIVLEMSGIPSLAFAVGVYLPLASSSPIFIGGMIRLLVDRYLRVKFRHGNLSEMELTAEGDKSPGVLLASGYIAGGAITGIVIAAKELVGPLAAMGQRIEEWQMAHNPFLNGPYSDLLALLPFAVLCGLLYLVGRDVLLVARSKARERRDHESFALPLTDPGAPPVISKRNEPSIGYHFVNLRPDRRGFYPRPEIIVDHNPTMIHQQIAVGIEVSTGIGVRVEYEKTHFTAAKDLPHCGPGHFMGRAPFDHDDIFKHAKPGQVLSQIFDDILARQPGVFQLPSAFDGNDLFPRAGLAGA